jgi:hypothetical protein
LFGIAITKTINHQSRVSGTVRRLGEQAPGIGNNQQQFRDALINSVLPVVQGCAAETDGCIPLVLQEQVKIAQSLLLS